MGDVIDNKKQVIDKRNDKTGLDNPREGQFKLGLGDFTFDFGIFF